MTISETNSFDRYTEQIYHSAFQPGGSCSAGAAISSVKRLLSKDHELEGVKQILTRLNRRHTLVSCVSGEIFPNFSR